MAGVRRGKGDKAFTAETAPVPVAPGRASPAERLEAIRALLLAGTSPHTIVDNLVRGLKMPKSGRIAKVTAAQARKDIRQLGAAWQHVHDDPLVIETMAGAALERLATIAQLAQAQGKYHAAISANRAILGTLGIRSSRWRRSDQESPMSSAGPGDESLRELSDEELEAEVARAEGRVVRLRLLGEDVIDGEELGERGTG